MNFRMLLAPLAFGLLVGIQSAEAQVVPYKGGGTDAAYNSGTGDYVGIGKSNLMGRTLLEGKVIPDGEFFPTDGIFFAGTFTGAQTLTAANGDTIEADLSGEVVLEFTEDGLVTGTWEPFFTITGGTGRFANVSGSFQGLAINPPFDPLASEIWAFDYFFDGKIDLGKKNKK